MRDCGRVEKARDCGRVGKARDLGRVAETLAEQPGLRLLVVLAVVLPGLWLTMPGALHLPVDGIASDPTLPFRLARVSLLVLVGWVVLSRICDLAVVLTLGQRWAAALAIRHPVWAGLPNLYRALLLAAWRSLLNGLDAAIAIRVLLAGLLLGSGLACHRLAWELLVR